MGTAHYPPDALFGRPYRGNLSDIPRCPGLNFQHRVVIGKDPFDFGAFLKDHMGNAGRKAFAFTHAPQ